MPQGRLQEMLSPHPICYIPTCLSSELLVGLRDLLPMATGHWGTHISSGSMEKVDRSPCYEKLDLPLGAGVGAGAGEAL